MEIWIAIVIGIVGGVVSSTIFYFLLRGLKPSIEISPYIARVDRNGTIYYDFKIINKSKRPLVDVRAHASLAKRVYAEGGPIYQTERIPLIRDKYFELGGFSLQDQNADYALRFATQSDLGSAWASDSDHVKLRVIATDSVSGFSKAFVQQYMTKRNSIKPGLHKFGNELDVS